VALADIVRDEIARRFGDRATIGEGALVATFPCPSGAVGDVVVEADEEEIVVGVVGMWHGHFDEGNPEQMVGACARFLDDLFEDRIVIWVAHENGRPKAGGCFYRLSSDMPPIDSGVPHDRRRESPPPGSRAATWSRPWPTDEAEG
jgi:hypothetical protein